MLSIVDLTVSIILPGGIRDSFDPQHMGKRELALGVPFLIPLKVNLSFIPIFIHAYTTFLMAQPEVNSLNRSEGSNPPTGPLSSQPFSTSSLQEKATSVLLQVFFCSASPKLSTSPALHHFESIRNHRVLTTAHHTSAKGSQPACNFPCLHTACAERE